MKKLLILTIVLAVGSVQAANVVWNNTSGDQQWDNPANWDSDVGGIIPGATDGAYLNGTSTATAIIDSDVGTVISAFVGQGGGNGSVEVVDGAVLTATGDLNMGADTSRSGTYNQSGGIVTVGSMFLVGGVNGGTGGESHATLSGGVLSINTAANGWALEIGVGLNAAGSSMTISGGALTAAGQMRVNNGILNIIGDDATITGTRVGSTVNAQVIKNSTLDLDFDETGISEIDISLGRLTLINGALDIDLSNYTGGNATFTLIDYAFWNVDKDAEFLAESVTGWAGGWDVTYASLGENAVGVQLELVPEPTTLSMITLLGGGLLWVRKRKLSRS